MTSFYDQLDQKHRHLLAVSGDRPPVLGFTDIYGRGRKSLTNAVLDVGISLPPDLLHSLNQALERAERATRAISGRCGWRWCARPSSSYIQEPGEVTHPLPRLPGLPDRPSRERLLDGLDPATSDRTAGSTNEDRWRRVSGVAASRCFLCMPAAAHAAGV